MVFPDPYEPICTFQTSDTVHTVDYVCPVNQCLKHIVGHCFNLDLKLHLEHCGWVKKSI